MIKIIIKKKNNVSFHNINCITYIVNFEFLKFNLTEFKLSAYELSKV